MKREIPGRKPEWRGVIEHIASGEKQYFKELDEIILYLFPFLENMNVEIGWRSRLFFFLANQPRVIRTQKLPPKPPT